MPLTLNEIELAFDSEEASDKILEYVNSRVDEWLSDQVFDDSEKAELYELETVFNQALSKVFEACEGDIEAAAEKQPGVVMVALSWLTIGGWVWSLDLKANPPHAEPPAQKLIDSIPFQWVFSFAAPHVPIGDFVLPHSLALVLSLTYPNSKDWLDAAQPLQKAHLNYSRAVNAKLKEIGEAQAFEKRLDMSSLLDAYENSKDRDSRKYFKRYFRYLSEEFRDQKYLGQRSVQDESHGGVSLLLFGHESLAICPEKRKPVEISASNVRSLSIGTLSQRMHTGYSYTDYEYWTIDILSTSGARWRVKALISVDNKDGNPEREDLTSLFGSISDFYTVVSSGRHAVSNTGYRTRVSYGVWF